MPDNACVIWTATLLDFCYSAVYAVIIFGMLSTLVAFLASIVPGPISQVQFLFFPTNCTWTGNKRRTSKVHALQKLTCFICQATVWIPVWETTHIMNNQQTNLWSRSLQAQNRNFQQCTDAVLNKFISGITKSFGWNNIVHFLVTVDCVITNRGHTLFANCSFRAKLATKWLFEVTDDSDFSIET